MEKKACTAGCLLVLGFVVFGGCRTSGVNEPERPSATRPAREKYADAMQALESADRGLREKAAIQLLTLSDPDGLAAVKKRMGSEYPPEMRVDMIQAASFAVSPECYGAILDVLDAKNAKVRRAAASAISRFGEPSQVEALIEKYESGDTPQRTRVLIIEAIGRGMFHDGIPVLLRALQGEAEDERRAARKALRLISGRRYNGNVEQWEEWWSANKHRSRGDFLANRIWVLRHDLNAAQQKADRLESEVEYLSKLVTSGQTNGLQPLLKALISSYPRVQEYAAYRLRQLEEEELKLISLDDRKIYKTFRKALRTAPPVVRQDVVALVVKLKGKYRNALIVEALKDDDPGVLVTAIDGLTAELSDAVQKRLVKLLKSSDPDVREAAANALGRTDCHNAVSDLIKTLDDPEENVRWFAVESIRKLHGKEAVPRLCELVEKDPSARVREIAATALGELDQPSAVPSLRNALGDKNERVKQRAASALKSLGLSSFDRALVVAGVLKKNGYWEDAVGLLRQSLEKAKKNKVSGEKLRDARLELASLLKDAGQYADAAAIYEKLSGSAETQDEVRRQLVECWIRGGESQRAVDMIKKWLQVESEKKRIQTLGVGLDALKLLKTRETGLADQTAKMLRKAAQEGGDTKIINKLEALGWPAEGQGESGTEEDPQNGPTSTE